MKFKTIVLALFIVFAVIGVGFLALYGRDDNGAGGGAQVEIWGTLSRNDISEMVRQANENTEGLLNILYIEKSASTYEEELLEAIASGNSPDVVFFPDEMIIRHANKVIPIPFESFPEQSFKESFIEAGEIFLSQEGITALPFSVDPLVLYWNRDIFSNEGLANPPKTWTELLALAPSLTLTDSNFNITRSAVALGEYVNVDNAKEIIYSLLLQVGNPVVSNVRGEYESSLRGSSENSSASAINFYTGFADPTRATYSWNRSLPGSKDSFVAGDLALYIGFVSEEDELKRRNPNLNFSIVELPQLEDTSKKTTFASISGFAVLRNTQNPVDAFNTLYALTGRDVVGLWSGVSGEPPVRRDLIRSGGDGSIGITHNSALWSRGIVEPDNARTSVIFRDMINSITSGTQSIPDALGRADETLQSLVEGLQ
jgi:ABC-type glycerol-3-phosphate transport system substrate-binding protein